MVPFSGDAPQIVIDFMAREGIFLIPVEDWNHRAEYMESLTGKLNLYMIPPALSLLVGVTLSLLTLGRGRRGRENIIYSLMFFWSVLIAPVFLCHHVFRGDTGLILSIDRTTHFFYVYMPSISILFTHTVVRHHNRAIVAASFALSFIVSLFTFSGYYFTGLWEFGWGYMAKPGPAFQLLGAHSLAVFVYSIALFVRALRREQDENVRQKQKFLILSMAIVGLMTLGNMPSMSGIDVYPVGTFVFIPLLVMAWGIFRHDVIRINMYTKRRISGMLVRVLVTAGLLAMAAAGVLILRNLPLEGLIDRTLRYGIPPLISLAFCTVISLLSLQLGENKKESFIFSVIMLFHSFLSLDVYLNAVITDPALGLAVSRLDHVFIVFVPALYLHLVYQVTGRMARRRIVYACYAVGFVLSLTTQSDWYIRDMYRYSWGFFAKKSFMFDIMSALSAFVAVYGSALLAVSYRKESNTLLKHRMRYILFGMLLSGVLSAGNFPAMHGIDIYPTGNFIFASGVFFAVGMLRYNITGMIRFARTALVYFGIALSLFLIALVHDRIGLTRGLPTFFRLLVAVLVFLAFRRAWLFFLNRIFPSRSDVLTQEFARLVSDIEKIHGMGAMGRAIAERMFKLLLSRSCMILLRSDEMNEYYGTEIRNTREAEAEDTAAKKIPKPSWVPLDHPLLELFRERRTVIRQADTEEWLINRDLHVAEDDLLRRAEIVLPVFFEDRLLALVLLGPKIDGSVYSPEESQFLYELCLNLGSHIENTRLIEDLEDKVRERTEDLNAALRETETINESLSSANRELKVAHARIRESEEKHRLIIENANDVISIVNADGIIQYISPSCERILGYSREELIGREWIGMLVPRGERKRVAGFYIDQMARMIPETQLRFPINRKDGAEIWLEQNGRIVVDDTGVARLYAIARDVTEQKKAEEERREIEEQKSRFFTNVSHEVRTPLTLMLSPLESYLQGDYGREPDRDFFGNLYRNGLRLLKLINNLLDFSKIESGRMTMKIAPVDIGRMLKNQAAALDSACESRGIALSVETKKVDDVFADAEKLERIFMNLFSNALKFTPRGGAIRVRMADGNGKCRIDFEDDGIGIPSGQIVEIFERFGQADTGSSRRYEGTGIGLALAREMAEMHGGTLTVESRYIEEFPDNHGSVFSVTLPKGKAHFEGRANVIFEKHAPDADSPDGGFRGMREMRDLDVGATEPGERDDETYTGSVSREGKPLVLVVDDNPDMRNFIISLLKREYAVVTAENGMQGLEEIRKHGPDMVITDVMMPVMDGNEMTRVVREDASLRHTPVIMLTARTDVSQKIEGLEHGADDYLTKPFNSRELLARVRTLLKTREYEKMVLRRNREIESELEVARMLQQRLLPAGAEKIQGYSTHAVYIPMDMVGGDFYDFTRHGDTIELFIADVSGHGLPGAFLAMMTKVALESVPSRASTGDVLSAVNDVICRATVNNNYVTAFLCAIDTRTNTLKFSNAGHFPPLVYRHASGEFIELNAKGMPLGWFRNITIEESEICLSPGDRLVLFTDGITECMSPRGEIFGDERFREFIHENRQLPPDAFTSALLARLKEFSGSDKFDDDLTMVVLDVE